MNTIVFGGVLPCFECGGSGLSEEETKTFNAVRREAKKKGLPEPDLPDERHCPLCKGTGVTDLKGKYK